MKKLITTALLIVAMVTGVMAQSQGDWMLGGNIHFSSNETTADGNIENKRSEFGILPSLHYFVSDNWAIGMGVGYTSHKDLINPAEELYEKLGIFEIRPSATYYLEICDRFYYTPEIYMQYGFGSNTVEMFSNNVTKVNVSKFGVGLKLASFEYILTDCVSFGLDLGFGGLEYTSILMTPEDSGMSEVRSNGLYFGLNEESMLGDISLSVSFRF